MVFYCAFPRSSPNTWPIDWSTAEPLHMENNAGLSCNLRGGITQWLLIFNFSFLSLHNLCSYCKHFWSRHIDSFGVWVPSANTLKSETVMGRVFWYLQYKWELPSSLSSPDLSLKSPEARAEGNSWKARPWICRLMAPPRHLFLLSHVNDENTSARFIGPSRHLIKSSFHFFSSP